MKPKKIKSCFKKALKDNGFKIKEISPDIVLQTLPKFWKDYEFDNCDKPQQGDMFLFQYGVYNWGNGPSFELDFTRQLSIEIDGEYDYMLQFHITFYYSSANISEEGFEKNFWSSGFNNLSAFINKIKESRGYEWAINQKPIKVKIDYERV